MTEEEMQKIKAEFKALVDQKAKVWKQYIDAEPWRMTTDQERIQEINRLGAALEELEQQKRKILQALGWNTPQDF